MLWIRGPLFWGTVVLVIAGILLDTRKRKKLEKREERLEKLEKAFKVRKGV